MAELGPASYIFVAGFVWEIEWGKGFVSLGSVPSSHPWPGKEDKTAC